MFFFPTLRTVSRRLLVCLSIADFCVAANYLLPGYKGGDWCEAQAIINVFANQAMFLWTDCIALYLYMSLIKGQTFAKNVGYPVFQVVSWGLPAILALVLLVSGEGGSNSKDTADWCWIKASAPKYWMIVEGKGLEWISYLFVAAMYIVIKIKLRTRALPISQPLIEKQFSYEETRKNIGFKLLFIPVAFILLRIPGTVRTVMSFAGSDDNQLWLRIFHAIGDTGQGWVNGLLFGVLTKKVRSSYLSACGTVEQLSTNNGVSLNVDPHKTLN